MARRPRVRPLTLAGAPGAVAQPPLCLPDGVASTRARVVSLVDLLCLRHRHAARGRTDGARGARAAGVAARVVREPPYSTPGRIGH
eukprot:2521331-Prymnesium_polylepis.1